MGDAKTREDCSEERLGEDWSTLTSSISRSGRGSHDIHVSNDDMVMLDETPNLQSDAESVLAPCSPRLDKFLRHLSHKKSTLASVPDWQFISADAFDRTQPLVSSLFLSQRRPSLTRNTSP